MKSWYASLLTFLKGLIMGIVNVFPISSGTISLVLGVYERFLKSIKSLNRKNMKVLFGGDFHGFAQKTDFRFFTFIMLGILLGMVMASVFLKHVLQSYEVQAWSYFIGLIVASVIYVLRGISSFKKMGWGLLAVGFVISFWLSIKSNPISNDGFLYLVLCGMVGSMGMVVPGISGSHLMLLMGNYELIVTEAIPWLTHASTFWMGLKVLLPFALGAVISIVFFSHLLTWLMRDYRDLTLMVLSGFMLGSLPVVYPWKEPSLLGTEYVFHLPPTTEQWLVALAMAVLGGLTVYLIEVLARRGRNDKAVTKKR